MFRNSILVASLIALSAMATTADAAVRKLPHDDCQKWEKREVMKNFWLKRQKVEAWYCVAGESKEHVGKKTLSGPSIASKRPNTPGTSDTPNTPDAPNTPDTAEKPNTPDTAGKPEDPKTPDTTTTTTDTPPSDDEPGKGNNGKGTPNGGPTDGGDPPGGGNTDNDGEG